jgi:hypothetical protein
MEGFGKNHKNGQTNHDGCMCNSNATTNPEHFEMQHIINKPSASNQYFVLQTLINPSTVALVTTQPPI